jgi:nucleotide-binding universal stress UspA family protein
MSRSKGPTSEGAVSFGRILVGVDFSRPGRRALLHALSLAREREAPLVALHVIDDHGLTDVARMTGVPEDDLRRRLETERRTEMERLLAAENPAPRQVRVEAVIAWGRPFEQILKRAATMEAGLIVLGTAGRSADLERALFGSTAEKVLRATPCPVLCVPTE